MKRDSDVDAKGAGKGGGDHRGSAVGPVPVEFFETSESLKARVWKAARGRIWK